jgi:hypothetical protein
MQPGFSASQTEWRRAQSGANNSPAEFPANREKYREFADFWSENRTSLSLNCRFYCPQSRNSLKTEQGISKRDQGNICNHQGINALQTGGGILTETGGAKRRVLTDFLRKTKLTSLLRPTERNMPAEFFKGQELRLSTLQNRFDDLWRQKGTLEYLPHIPFGQSYLLCE